MNSLVHTQHFRFFNGGVGSWIYFDRGSDPTPGADYVGVQQGVGLPDRWELVGFLPYYQGPVSYQ